MSEQHGGEGAGRPHISAECSQSSFPARPCGLNDGVQGCAVLLWNIKSARPPSVDRPPASKRGVRRARRSDVPQQHTCTTHTYACMKKNGLANVPTQDEPVGLHMLTLMDINTYKINNNKKTPLRTWKHSDVGGEIRAKMFWTWFVIALVKIKFTYVL